MRSTIDLCGAWRTIKLSRLKVAKALATRAPDGSGYANRLILRHGPTLRDQDALELSVDGAKIFPVISHDIGSHVCVRD